MLNATKNTERESWDTPTMPFHFFKIVLGKFLDLIGYEWSQDCTGHQNKHGYLGTRILPAMAHVSVRGFRCGQGFSGFTKSRVTGEMPPKSLMPASSNWVQLSDCPLPRPKFESRVDCLSFFLARGLKLGNMQQAPDTCNSAFEFMPKWTPPYAFFWLVPWEDWKNHDEFCICYELDNNNRNSKKSVIHNAQLHWDLFI